MVCNRNPTWVRNKNHARLHVVLNMSKYIAVCPKCETMYKLNDYYPDYYCICSPETLEVCKGLTLEEISDSIPPYIRILCKIVGVTKEQN